MLSPASIHASTRDFPDSADRGPSSWPVGLSTGGEWRIRYCPAMSTDSRDVVALLYRYADALDRREWAALDGVFAADVRADYAGSEIVSGRESLVGMIRGYLDNCGATQHLMGNEQTVVDGDRARVTAKMRVHHIGPSRPELTYEVFGWYHAEAARTSDGWRIVVWRQEVTHELGTYEVFARA